MDERTQKLIDTYKAQGPLTTGQIGDVFATTKAPSEIPTPTPVPTTQKAPNLPEPQAQNIQENFVASLSKQAENARKTLEDTYKIQREALDKEKEALEIKQQGYLSQIDPETRPTYEQETRIMQNQLDASEAASKTLQKNFEEKQKLVDELDTLLTQGNQLIEQQRMASTSISAGNQMMQITLRDVAARTGVIEAVLSARDGQIGQAHNIINQARGAVEAQWNDKREYYATLLNYNESKILNLDKESKAIAQKELGLIEKDLANVEATTNYLKELMLDPKTAQFVAEAGIKLTDSIEEINTKMAKQAQVVEIREETNRLVEKGYTQVPMGTAGAVPVSIGGKTVYFKPPKDKGENNNEEYVQAEEFVNANPQASDAELKSALLRDSNLSVTQINAIIASRQGKITLTDIDAKNVGIELIQENFEKKFWSSRSGELESAKEKAKKELGNLNLSDGDKIKLETAIDNITIDEIEI